MLGAPYFLAFALVVTAIAAWHDWRTGHIPDWITLGPLLAAPVLHFGFFVAQGRSAEALDAGLYSVLGAALCAAVPIALYRVDGMFGGDVKLLAAVGAILRPVAGIEAEFFAFVAAALIAPARLAYEGKLTQVLANTVALVVNPFRPKHRRREVPPEMMTKMRFGPAIFAGTCAAALTHWRS